MSKYDDVQKILEEKERFYLEEVEQLNRMAEEALASGKPLGKDMKLLEQSKRADQMILDIQHLKDMLAEYDAREAEETEE